MKEKANNEPLVPRENDENLSRNVPTCPRGWLRNGNPPGDLTKVKRCDARSKRHGQPCQQPAMNSGRCRFHGGKSTGPKTSEGKRRSAEANLKDGYYSQESQHQQKMLRDFLKQAQELLKQF